MSGRKQSEVLDLLSTGNAIREKVLKNNYLNFWKSVKENNELKDKIEIEKKKLDFSFFQIPKAIEEKYKQEVNLMKEEIKAIEEWSKNINLNDMKSDVEEFEKIDKEFKNCDTEADKLRNTIKGKSHYCDSEYNQAQNLVSVYRNKLDRVVKIDRTISSQLGVNKEKIAEIEYKLKRKEEIEDKYNQLKIRTTADNNREQIKEELEKINRNDVEKFYSNEYKNLIEEINNIVAENNELVNKKSEELFIKIAKLKQKSSEARAEYEMKKTKANISLDKLNEINNSYRVLDIEALLEEKELTLSLFEFEKRYGLNSYEKKYFEGIKEVENLIKQEEFDKAKATAEYIEKELNIQIDKARKQYERLLKEQDIASKIVKAVNNLGYDQIDIEYIGGDINNGYKLSAIVGDEILEFERIAIDDNGNQILDLNHKESVTGQCGHSMKKVMNAMQDEGIFITDIKKNGVSMVYSKTERSNNVQKNELKREVR